MSNSPGPQDGAPNAFVAEHAAQRGRLALDDMALIGVAGHAGELRALVRLPDGAILSTREGESTALGRVLEVSPAGVVLELASGNASFLRPYPWGLHTARR